MKGHAIIGFNHGVLGFAENPARGTGFWSQNTEGVARVVLTEKPGPSTPWLKPIAQHPMIKTYSLWNWYLFKIPWNLVCSNRISQFPNDFDIFHETL